MIKFSNLLFTKCILVFLILFIPNYNTAKEILIYADSISYDKDENIIAKELNANKSKCIFLQKEKKLSPVCYFFFVYSSA